MPLWRCPHCGTPQAEASRCWVCRRSSTTCSTCRHFRRSIAAQVGYCGLDPGRAPLVGTELRGCWEAGPERAAHALPVVPVEQDADGPPFDGPVMPGAAPPAATMRLRDFVPVELRRSGKAPRARGERAPATRSRRALEREAAENAAREDPAVHVEVPPPPPDVAWSERVTLFADGEV